MCIMLDEINKKILEGKSCIWISEMPQYDPIQIDNRFYRVLYIDKYNIDDLYSTIFGYMRDNETHVSRLCGFKMKNDFYNYLIKHYLDVKYLYFHYIAYQTTIGD